MIAAEKIKYLQNRIARSEDQWAYKELFSEFYSYLTRFARSFVRSKELAEEIVSDVFIKIWEKRSRLEEITNLKLYLYVATRNTALNYLERQTKTSTFPIDELAPELGCLSFDPEQLLITAEMMARIQRAIDALPPKCKMVYKLIKEDQLAYKEVADIMQIAIKTVENQLAIAIQKISSAISFDIKRTIPSSLNSSK